MTTIETEVAVIGSGPGGYAAAFHAADRGMKVCLIDSHSRPGGVCLHVGCIPSKALLHAAALLHEAKQAKAWGIEFSEPTVDLDRLRGWKTQVVDQLVSGLEKLCKARGVTFVHGHAVFIDSERLQIEDAATEGVHFEHAVLATGSSPICPEALKLDSPRVMDSTAALELEEIPERLLVVGGGYIGLELATVYSALGARVTIVEMTEGLLPGVDRELVRPVLARMKRSADALYFGTRVTGLREVEGGIEATMEGAADPPVQTFDRVLVSVGRRPNSAGIGLENTKVQIDDRSFVRVDSQRRTDDERVFAIGDVAGEPMLAHKAAHEARVAIEAMSGEASVFEPLAIPAVVFTNPEIAWCGLTETEAKNDGTKIEVRRFPWGASGRAITLDRTDGMTKIVCDPRSRQILGMGIVGVGAGDLIAEGVVAIEMGATAEDLAECIHPHPTLSETMMESAELFLGSSTHLYRPPRKKPKG